MFQRVHYDQDEVIREIMGYFCKKPFSSKMAVKKLYFGRTGVHFYQDKCLTDMKIRSNLSTQLNLRRKRAA